MRTVIPAARWMKFNLVGAIGVVAQLGALALFTSVLRLDYMIATTLAVETAVLHNFAWHERYTWADRSRRGWQGRVMRLLRFNLTTGAVSIGGNLILMRLLTGKAHIPALVANLMSIAVVSALNFCITDRWVFRTTSTNANTYP